MSNEFTGDALDRELALHKENISKDLQEKFKNKYDGFWEFEKYLDPKFFTKDRLDLKLTAYVLYLFYWRHFDNVAISMPRRRGKSHQVNDLVKYAIGYNPERSNSRFCYSEKNLKKFSRFIKKSITSGIYLDAFPDVQLEKDDKEVLSWSITAKEGEPTYYSATTSGQATGTGVNNLQIDDDLIKGFKEVHSTTEMDTLSDFIEAAIVSCAEPGSRRMEIATRWADHDPIGKVLEAAKNSGEKVITFDAYETRLTEKNINDFIKKLYKTKFTEYDWVEISIPALNKFNESTAPKFQSAEKLLKIKEHLIRVGKSHVWYCIYQQQPRPKGARLFHDFNNFYYLADMKEQFKKAHKVVFIDASGKGQNNTAAPLGYIINKNDVYIDPEIVYTPEEPRISRELLTRFIIKHQPNLVVGEGGWAGEEYVEALEEKILENIEEIKIANNDFNYDFYGIDIESTTENKELKIFLESENIKLHVHLPAEFDKDGKRQYELDSPMWYAIKSLTKYVGKVDGKFIKNQEDDFLDALIGILRAIGIIEDFSVDII
jgi:hypothetical protein